MGAYVLNPITDQLFHTKEARKDDTDGERENSEFIYFHYRIIVAKQTHNDNIIAKI